MAKKLTLKDTDKISRFIRSGTHVKVLEVGQIVTFKAFMPDSRKYSLSTYHTNKMTEKAIWVLASNENIKQQDGITKVHQRAEFITKLIKRAKLAYDYDNDPERHVSLIGWPDPKLQKKDRSDAKLTRQESAGILASKSKLFDRP